MHDLPISKEFFYTKYMETFIEIYIIYSMFPIEYRSDTHDSIQEFQ